MLAFDIEKAKLEGEFTGEGWFMSEKLDGIRCFWNGKNLYSRNGNIFHCPEWFTENWPNC